MFGECISAQVCSFTNIVQRVCATCPQDHLLLMYPPVPAAEVGRTTPESTAAGLRCLPLLADGLCDGGRAMGAACHPYPRLSQRARRSVENAAGRAKMRRYSEPLPACSRVAWYTRGTIYIRALWLTSGAYCVATMTSPKFHRCAAIPLATSGLAPSPIPSLAWGAPKRPCTMALMRAAFSGPCAG